jgi:hypothetical protein
MHTFRIEPYIFVLQIHRSPNSTTRSLITVLKIAMDERVKVVFCAYRNKNIELSKHTEQNTLKIRNIYAH